MPTIAITVTTGAYDTYDDLVAAIPDYLDSQIDATQVPGWIGLVEAEINRRLALNPVRPQLTRQSITLGSEYVTLPADFQKEVALEYVDDEGVRREVKWVDFTGLVDDVANPIPETWLFSSNPDYTERPEVAAVVDGEIRLFPVPDQSYSGNLLYNARLDGIGDANQQNWFIAAHSDVYLYGVLFHANAFLPDKETAQGWFDLFDSRLQQVLTAYPKAVSRRTLRSDAVYMSGNHRRTLV